MAARSPSLDEGHSRSYAVAIAPSSKIRAGAAINDRCDAIVATLWSPLIDPTCGRAVLDLNGERVRKWAETALGIKRGLLSGRVPGAALARLRTDRRDIGAVAVGLAAALEHGRACDQHMAPACATVRHAPA